MRPLVAHIDLAALCHNAAQAAACAPDSQVMAIIKADAYGHGALECAQALKEEVACFAVASTEEAIGLREAGIQLPLVLLEGFFSHAEVPLLDTFALSPVVHSDWQLKALLDGTFRHPLEVWLKVNTGMHRLGFSPREVPAAWQALSASPQIGRLHLMSHFAGADLAQGGGVDAQMEQINTLRTTLAASGDVSCCLANSPATLSHPQTHAAWNRPGVMLYGSNPLARALPNAPALRPVMSLRSQVIALQEVQVGERVGYGGRWQASRHSRIAIVAAGYGDGYDRHAADGTPVLVNGKRAALAGRVSMDMLSVDVTDLDGVAIGSEVVLWGAAQSGERLSVDEVAAHCDTISYTLLTGVMPRVPRHYRR